MKINIEGGEYELLDRLLDTGLINIIDNLQVQFHDHVDGAIGRMQRIQSRLGTKFNLTYQVPFVWENWHRVSTAAATSLPLAA